MLRDGDGRLTCEDDILYESLHEPALDWGVIGTLTDKLVMLDIAVPESLIKRCLDQSFNAGNHVVRHHADRPPEVLLALSSLPRKAVPSPAASCRQADAPFRTHMNVTARLVASALPHKPGFDRSWLDRVVISQRRRSNVS